MLFGIRTICSFLLIVVFHVCLTSAAYCTKYYSRGIYSNSFYCSSACCGSSHHRYCCDTIYWSIGSIIGAVIGAIIGLIVLIVLIVCVCAQCNKRSSHGTIVHPNQPQVTMISNSQQQQQQMYRGPAYPKTSYPPQPQAYPPQPQQAYPPQPQQANLYTGHPQPMPPPPYPGQGPFPTKQ